jgi:RimJ/RimL family protein N-acetyltransferase
MIETPRLLLRRWKRDDLDDYAAICSDPEVMRWIGDGSTLTRDQSADQIERIEKHWKETGFGLFAAESKATLRLCGFVGLSTPSFLPEVLPAVEIGWRLAREEWGRGLATEGARRAMGFAFGLRELDRVISIGHVENKASLRIMEKLGMRLERGTTVRATGMSVQVWEIASADWV